MTDKEARDRIKIEIFALSKEFPSIRENCPKSMEAFEKAIFALDTCDLMSRGIPYITHNGRIYKLTDEKGDKQ